MIRTLVTLAAAIGVGAASVAACDRCQQHEARHGVRSLAQDPVERNHVRARALGFGVEYPDFSHLHKVSGGWRVFHRLPCKVPAIERGLSDPAVRMIHQRASLGHGETFHFAVGVDHIELKL